MIGKSLNHNSFTLVEILVVTSIIGLLAGVAIPVIGGAQKKAKAGACLSNLRQIGLATLAYAAENDGMFPEAGTGGTPAWATSIAAFISVDTKNKKSVFVCPGCEKPVSDASTGEVAVTYGMHGGLMPKGGAGARLISVQRPSQVILCADMCQNPANKGWAPFSIENPPIFTTQTGGRGGVQMDTPISTATDSDDGNNPWMRYRHSGKVNVVMCDGHAESFKKGSVLNKNAIFTQ